MSTSELQFTWNFQSRGRLEVRFGLENMEPRMLVEDSLMFQAMNQYAHLHVCRRMLGEGGIVLGSCFVVLLTYIVHRDENHDTT